MRGVARGARRPKSRFGSSLEPLSHIRVTFYERETQQLVRISQCELMESFVEAQRSYNANVAFSLMAEITEAVLPEHEASDPAFRLLLSACRAIQKVGLVTLPVTYFALWTLRLGGWLPPLDRCSRCGRSLSGSAAWASEDGSGVHCQKCRTAAGRPISAEALVVVQPMLRESLDALVAGGGTRVPTDLMNYLMDLIERHIERKLNVRPMLEIVP